MNRSRFLTVLLGALLVTGLMSQNVNAEPMTIYIGTYVGPKSKGIYTAKFDPATGTLSQPEVAAELKNPSFLTLHPSNKYLYAIGEEGKGVVVAYSVDAASGKLTQLNSQTTGGNGPCFVSVDQTGKVCMVANYGGGSVESLPVKEDGSLGEPASFHQHAGKGPTPRQKGPNAHSINVTPDNKYAVAADLGLDKLLVYKLDTATAKLTPNDPAFAATPPGGGPRHVSFHPNGKYLYVCNEMGMAATAFSYDGERGTLTEIGTVPTLPEGAERKGASTAECLVHPSGKFLYVSNRGHDTIAVFAIDQATGKLTPAGHASSGGKTPRNFRIDPTGQWLLAANQGTHNIAVLKIDQASGALSPTGTSVEVGSPVCIKFVVAPPAK